ncbi:hypothetical protein SDC9_11424 [bioreactor metagenome]|uniref:Uncharacterized protein n=1 Tax=bioreactor metagenome TaxID=1076179 RepID=A0A644TFX8_9ZZZZ|nr:DUF5320 domain-containing protein [Negativicutes bacterium]
MPRGDGTGPMGNGPLSRGRGGCQRMNGYIRNTQDGFGLTNGAPAAPESLESQAERLEAQAATLRNLAKQNRK